MDIELLACHGSHQQELLPPCNIPALETFNSCTYSSNLNHSIHSNAYDCSLCNIPSSNLVRFPSLPNSLQFEGLKFDEQQQQKDCCLRAEICKELRVRVADQGHGGPVCDPPVARRKQASMKHASQAESLRRKKISQWFSKLEILLPQNDIPKFDRCSLIDAAIRYIRSLEKTISEASQEKERSASVERIGKQQKVEACKRVDSTTTAAEEACVNYTANCDDEGVISISVIEPEHVFINAITSHTDPVLFSAMLSVLHQHHLHVLNANLTRSADKVVFSFYAKVSSTRTDYDRQSLKENLSSVFTSLGKA